MSPKIKKIYSENNDFQHIEVIKRNREKRSKYKEFFVEGVKPLEQVLRNNWEIVSLIYTTQRKLSNWAKTIISNSTTEIHYDLSGELMDKLSDKEESSELIAIVSMPRHDFSRIRIDSNLLLIVFDRPSSYGNLGTIIRTCDSFKTNGLIITGHCVDLYDPQTIRASMGSLFSIPVLKVEQRDLFEWLSKIRSMYPDFQMIGTSAKTDQNISNEDFTKPTALFLGNETEGLSRIYKTSADRLVSIPIYGSATSLNVACAASICLYEIDRQRRQE